MQFKQLITKLNECRHFKSSSIECDEIRYQIMKWTLVALLLLTLMLLNGCTKPCVVVDAPERFLPEQYREPMPPLPSASEMTGKTPAIQDGDDISSILKATGGAYQRCMIRYNGLLSACERLTSPDQPD